MQNPAKKATGKYLILLSTLSSENKATKQLLCTLSGENIDFGILPDYSVTDVAINITSLNGVNPGFETCYILSYKNFSPRFHVILRQKYDVSILSSSFFRLNRSSFILIFIKIVQNIF